MKKSVSSSNPQSFAWKDWDEKEAFQDFLEQLRMVLALFQEQEEDEVCLKEMKKAARMYNHFIISMIEEDTDAQVEQNRYVENQQHQQRLDSQLSLLEAEMESRYPSEMKWFFHYRDAMKKIYQAEKNLDGKGSV